MRVRVYEIAKEMGIPNKDVISVILELGLKAHNHMSWIDGDDAARIKRSLKEKGATATARPTISWVAVHGHDVHRRTTWIGKTRLVRITGLSREFVATCPCSFQLPPGAEVFDADPLDPGTARGAREGYVFTVLDHAAESSADPA